MKKEVRSMQDAKLKQKARETLLKGKKQQQQAAASARGERNNKTSAAITEVDDER
jgi:hypothetical protein